MQGALVSEATRIVIDFVEGRLGAEQFEHILYERPEFEDILNNDPKLPPNTYVSRSTYLYVISQDFSDPSGLLNVHRALTEYLQRNGFLVNPTDRYVPPQPYRIARLRLECADCGAWSTVPDLGDFAYGEWILHTPVATDTAYLSAFENPVFDEVRSLVNELLADTGLTSGIKATCFQKVFGWACDPAPSGHRYDLFNNKLWCYACGSTNIRRHTDIPYVIQEFYLRTPTHKAWQHLEDREKRELLKKALRTVGCLEPLAATSSRG